MRSSGKEDRSVAKGELIGLHARVVASHDATLLGQEGVVVDETKHTLRVELPSGREVVWPKPGQRFAFQTREGLTTELDGRAIAHQPEDRIKKSR